MTKRFECPECGPIETALFDGYPVGGRQLEGVMFRGKIVNDKIELEYVDDPNTGYLEGLNTDYWLEKMKNFVNRGTDMAECSNNNCVEDIDIIDD